MIGAGLLESPAALDLPPLPSSQIVMLARTPGPEQTAAARALAASVRDTLRRSVA